MPYELSKRLVIGMASSALFDLKESDAVFREHGEQAYREFQEEHLDDALQPGVAYPFVRRLLSLNDLAEDQADPLVEVIVLSRNDPDTGLRVMHSIDAHKLPITRAIFMQGKSPHKFMKPLQMSLFLSANERDVRAAIALGLPAGHVQDSTITDDGDNDLRIAFDFDGVLADDASEQVFADSGLKVFQAHEQLNMATPHEAGPLKDLLAKINAIQRVEEARRLADRDYEIRLHVAIVTARNAPAHERAIRSLKEWGVTVNDAFFLGGIEKGPILETLKPHIYFDDQRVHLTAGNVPSVHIPFGVRNVEQPERNA